MHMKACPSDPALTKKTNLRIMAGWAIFALALLGGLSTSNLAAKTAKKSAATRASSCIVFINSWYTPTKDKILSVEIDGYPNQSWTIPYGATIGTLATSSGQPVRGASFTARVYDGAHGSDGGTLIGSVTSPVGAGNIWWTYASPGQTIAKESPDCVNSGIWLLQIHDPA